MSVLQLFKPITCFVFDIDGVLTDGSLFVFENGDKMRRMNIKDGYALQLAIKKGYHIAVISGANGEGATSRLNKLGIKDVFVQIENKTKKLGEYLNQHNLDWKEVLYMGDDIPDYEVMKKAGLPCAPADAASAIKDIAKYISPCKGGEGCVRDVIEKTLILHGHWAIDTKIASK